MRPDGVLLIAAGGAIGTLVRYLIAEGIEVSSFPWHTLLVNIVGCGLLAAVTAPTRPKTQQRILGTGFCGGLTTFSTLSVEVVSMMDDGNASRAGLYLLASVVAGLVAYVSVRTMSATSDGLQRPESF